MNTKQVIIVRKDLKMRAGKMAAQCCHASMAFLTRNGGLEQEYLTEEYGFCYPEFRSNVNPKHYYIIEHWLKNSFKKVVCYVNSEEELLELFEKAKEKGMLAHLVEDNGATEFKGVKTITALAIGPDVEENFEGLTNHLPLL